MPGSINEQRTMNYLTMNNKYVPDISVYSCPFAVKSFIWLNLVFFSVNLRQSAISADKNMQNEPNLVLSEVEWIKQITHFINEQRTMVNEQFTNEPNLRKTNPILPAILSIYAIACALGGKYLGVLCALGGFKQKMSNEPNLVLSEVEWIKQITHFINEQRTMINEQFTNEPNLKKHQNKRKYCSRKGLHEK